LTRRHLSFGSLSLALVALPYSIMVCHIALILFLLVWVTEGEWLEKWQLVRKNIVVLLIVAFSGMQLVGMFYTENTTNGWLAIEKKIFLLLIPIALATTFIRFDRREIYRMFNLFVVSCIIGSFICIGSSLNELLMLQRGEISANELNYLNASPAAVQAAASDPWLVFSYVELADGIHMHPTYLSLYLAFCVIVLFYRLLTGSLPKLESAVTKIIIVYFTIFIVSLSSRIVILSLATLYAIMIIESYWRSRPKSISVMLLSLMLILALTLYFNPISRYRNLDEVASSSYDVQPKTLYKTSTEIRVSLWWLAVQGIRNVNPFLGTGTGDVGDLMFTISERYGIKNILDSYNPHNEFLYILLGNGLVSLAIFISLLAIPFRKALQQRNYMLVGFLFLIVSICLTETILERQKGIAFFALIFPLLAFQQNTGLENKHRDA
jgi:O-antigen ligase